MAAPDVTGEELRPLLFSLAYRMVGSLDRGRGSGPGGLGPGRPGARRRRDPVAGGALHHDRDHPPRDRPPAPGPRRRREPTSGRGCPSRCVDGAGAAAARADWAATRCSLRSWSCWSRWAPIERALFVLHEGFGLHARTPRSPRCVGKTQANCRQIAGAGAPARRAPSRPRFEPSRARARGAARALPRPPRATGDVQALVDDARRRRRLSTPTAAARRPRRGCRSTAPAKVARLWAKLGAEQRSGALGLADVNGQPGVVATDADGRADRPCSRSMSPTAAVQTVWAVVNPDKLDPGRRRSVRAPCSARRGR